MNTMQFVQAPLMLVLLLYFLTPNAQAQSSAGVKVTPSQIKWNDNPVLPKGAKATTILGDAMKPGPFVVRVKLPANAKVMAHAHPIDHEITVLSGTLYYAEGDKFDAKKLKAFPAQSFLVEPAKVPHFLAAKREVVIQVNGTGPSGFDYVDPKDFPQKK